MEVGTWPGHASHICGQRTGECQLCKSSQFHCGCIWRGPGRLTFVYSTWFFPTWTTTPFKSRCTSLIWWYSLLIRWYNLFLTKFKNYHFVDPIIHWSPASPLDNSLQSTRTCQNFFRAGPLMMRCVYLTLTSTSINEVVSGWYHGPTPVARKAATVTSTTSLHCSIRVLPEPDTVMAMEWGEGREDTKRCPWGV